MTTLKKFFIIAIALLLSACATTPLVPVALDTNVPAAVDEGGLQAALRVLDRSEVDSFFGGGIGARLRVLELKVENRGAAAVSVGAKQIRIVTPSGERQSALTPLNVATAVSRGGMTANGNNVLDAIQAIIALGAIKQAYNLAESWSYLMPETLKVASGQERHMLLAFPTPDWAAGTWRLELPFAAEHGASRPQLSIPLTFRELTVK